MSLDKLKYLKIKGKKYIVIDKYMYCDSQVLGEGAFGKVYKGMYVPIKDK
jgi:hypothetical protein